MDVCGCIQISDQSSGTEAQNLQMDIQARIGSIASQNLWSRKAKTLSSYTLSPLRPFCKGRRPQQSQQNGDSNNNDDDRGDDKFSTDWDKAWSSFRKQGKKTLFSDFFPNKYVTWNPKQSDYPLSEEVDPIKRTERSNLMLWTGPGFTLSVAIVIVTFLLVYTILAPIK